MEHQVAHNHDGEPYSTLESLGPPAYSGLQLAPPSQKPYDDLDGKEVVPVQDTEPHEIIENGRRRVCGLPLPWILIIVGVLVLAAISATIGGVLATKAASNGSSLTSPAVYTVYISASASPSSTPDSPTSSIDAVTSTLSPSSTSLSSSGYIPPSQAASPFGPDKWYQILSGDLSLDQTFPSQILTSNRVTVALVPYSGYDNNDFRQHWQFRLATSKFDDFPPDTEVYAIYHRAAGPEYQLAVGNLEVELEIEKSVGTWRPEFARTEEAEEHRCYWYIEDKGEYVVIKNLESGESYPMTGRSDWASMKMAGERMEEEFWEGPPRGSRRFVVKESGVDVDVGEGWVIG